MTLQYSKPTEPIPKILLGEAIVTARRTKPVIDELKKSLEKLIGDVRVLEAIVDTGTPNREDGFLYVSNHSASAKPRVTNVRNISHPKGCSCCNLRPLSYFDSKSTSKSPSGIKFLTGEGILRYSFEGSHFTISTRESMLPYLPSKKLLGVFPTPRTQLDGQLLMRAISEVSIRLKQPFDIKRG